MRVKLLQAFAFALGLASCATVHSLDATPEEVADRIAGDAVAYNEAYGRAIADQVLLNVLRARDRLPLYHLSMSGITESSSTAEQNTLGIGSITLGGEGSPWGVGSISTQRTATTQPGYVLNPFSSDSDHPRARQYEPISFEVVQHFLENDWPLEMLLLVTVDEMIPLNANRTPRWADRLSNDGANYRGDDCANRSGAIELRRRCEFLWTIQDLRDDESLALELRRGLRCVPLSSTQGQRERCNARLRVERIRSGQRTWVASYDLSLRSIDDMIYYVGSLLRTEDMASAVKIRPTGVYPDDRESWSAIQRTSHLFRVTQAPEQPAWRAHRAASGSAFAAEVRYRGARYRAGPGNARMCVGVAQCQNALEPDANDSSATVLSMLTRLVIISQSEEAQLAPILQDVRRGN